MTQQYKQAMVMAAGLGTRLRPLTLNTPKPLLPLNDQGACCLSLTIQGLIKAGFDRIIVNAFYLPNQIESFIKQNFPNVIVSTEHEPLETGGGLLNALPLFDRNAPIVIVNGDTYIENISSVITNLFTEFSQKQQSHNVQTLLALSTVNHEQGLGIGFTGCGDYFIEPFDDQNKSIGQLKFRSDAPSAPFVFIGPRIINPAAINWEPFKETKSFSMLQLFHAAEKKGELAGMVFNKPWCDLSTVAVYEQLKNYLSL